MKSMKLPSGLTPGIWGAVIGAAIISVPRFLDLRMDTRRYCGADGERAGANCGR